MPQWIENRKAIHTKLEEEPRQKLGIIPEEEEDFLQRSLLPSYERHPNH